MIDQDPNETAQISGSDFAQMCDEMKQLRAERDRPLSELADERAKKSDALIAAVDDIERLTAERDDAAALAKNYAERMARSDAELAILIADRGTLRAALELIAAPMRPDGTYNRDRTACGSIARAALATPAQ